MPRTSSMDQGTELRQMSEITVTAAIIVMGERVLAAKRRAGVHMAGMWEFPGGKVEADETPEQCLVRELSEEFGIETKVGRYLGENVHDYGEKIVRLMAFEVSHVGGAFTLNDHDELKWLARGELYQLDWAPADIPLIAQAALILGEERRTR